VLQKRLHGAQWIGIELATLTTARPVRSKVKARLSRQVRIVAVTSASRPAVSEGNAKHPADGENSNIGRKAENPDRKKP
jgi:hypothetical protein